MHFPGFSRLHLRTREELVQYLDGVGNVTCSVDFVMNEIHRRDEIAEWKRRLSLELSLSAAARKWMVFVDGENFAIRGAKVLSDAGFDPEKMSASAGGHFHRDVFLWMPGRHPREYFFPESHLVLRPRAIRAHYYTSRTGDAEALEATRLTLAELGFHPEVFKRPHKCKKCKGVDITLAKDFLLHGFQGNYDVAVLVSGDGDFAPLVEEVKRFGRSVVLAFPGTEGLSPKLRAECDEFFDLTQAPELFDAWRPRDI